jgi:hypothetical protein
LHLSTPDQTQMVKPGKLTTLKLTDKKRTA